MSLHFFFVFIKFGYQDCNKDQDKAIWSLFLGRGRAKEVCPVRGETQWIGLKYDIRLHVSGDEGTGEKCARF